MNILRLCIWFALLVIIFVPLEKLFARRTQKIFRKEFANDLVYYFLNSILPSLLLIVPLSVIAWGVHQFLPEGVYNWGATLSVRMRLLLAIVIGDFGGYWGHRWLHEIPFLWGFHSIHHSAKEIDWLVNTRAHPIDMVFNRFCGLSLIYLLGLAQPTGEKADIVPLLYVVIGTIWSFFIHANIRWRFGWLERLISTPAFHHWHHTNDEPRYVNKNYAAIFPWIDQLFGTLYLPRNRWPKIYGTNTFVAEDLVRQLLEPLKSGVSHKKGN